MSFKSIFRKRGAKVYNWGCRKVEIQHKAQPFTKKVEPRKTNRLAHNDNRLEKLETNIFKSSSSLPCASRKSNLSLNEDRTKS